MKLLLTVSILIILLILLLRSENMEGFEVNKKAEIKFTKNNKSKNGITLKNNTGAIENTTKIISNKSTIFITYSVSDDNEQGTLLEIPDNFCKISLETTRFNIYLFLTYMHTVYQYTIPKKTNLKNRTSLIIALVLNETGHELYVNKNNLVHGQSIIRDNNTKYKLSTNKPILINKDKKLSGLLHSIFTYNKILSEEEIISISNYIIKNNIKIRDIDTYDKFYKFPAEKVKPKKQKKTQNPCVFMDNNLCKKCGNPEINIKRPSIKYQKGCQQKIAEYCESNYDDDDTCKVIDFINNF
tara:strand:- start:8157 stop:9050 length:894 start_codon:yes stop_codon:yes gene_type:complete